MKKAYSKDIIETIKKGKKRFLSLMMITILGVGMFNGIRAACVDLRHSADAFLDEQRLFDISIVSTMGLTEEDVLALEPVEGVEAVEGSYSETVHVINGDKTQNAEIKVLTAYGINVPFVLDGRLPESASEIAVTEKYITETGKNIGDIIKI